MKIVLVELPPTPNGKLFEKPARDIYSYFCLPSRAIDVLKSIAEQAGFTDTHVINPRHNEGIEIINQDQLDLVYSADVVGISAITRTAPQSYELADLIRKNNPDAQIIFGGPHSTALPGESLEHCDYVVRNEGDITFPELLCSIQESPSAPMVEDIKGISFRINDGGIRHNPARIFTTSDDLTALPLPSLTKECLKKAKYVTINTSRGCPYACEFCSVVSQFGSEYRTMSIERTLEYIKLIIKSKRPYGKFSIFFGDDHFAANIPRTKELLRRILKEIPDIPRWTAQVRVETAADPELLDLMKAAGCFKVYIGFESINEDALKAWNKRQNVDKIRKAIDAYHQAGITIHGMFILGSDYDTTQTVLDTVRFANRHNIDTKQFISLLPLPGTPLTATYEKEGKILSREWHLYSGHRVLIKPALMTPKELQKAIIKAARRFYNIPQVIKQFFRFSLGPNWKSNLALRAIGTVLRFLMVREIKTVPAIAERK